MGLLAALGTLLWNLGVYTSYTAGASLSLELAVANPTAAARSYKLYLDIIQNGVVVHSETLTVDANTEFEVAADGSKSVTGTFSFLYTDAILRVRLWDVTTEEYIDTVSTSLYSPVAAYYAPTQVTDIFGQMMPMIMMIIMLAMIMPMMRAK